MTERPHAKLLREFYENPTKDKLVELENIFESLTTCIRRYEVRLAKLEERMDTHEERSCPRHNR